MVTIIIMGNDGVICEQEFLSSFEPAVSGAETESTKAMTA